LETIQDNFVSFNTLLFLFRQHLETDMKDPELTYWTSSPNCLLVVSDEERSRILGMISMQKRDEETAELNRLVVRPEARGLGLGRRLVLGLIGEAANQRFKQIYLETTDAQKDARRLYEKIGFTKVGEGGLFHLKNNYIPSCVHGLFVCKYSYIICSQNKALQ
jgi:ribosomal protein S18 acetylase RimI-like enzyme